MPSQAILDRRGWRLTETITSDVWARCGPCLSLPHARLHAILGAALGESRVRHDVSVAAVDQSSGLCEVAFTDGRSAFYDLVVGADGIHSRVRRIVRPDIGPQYGRQVCWRFITHNVSGIEGWTAMLGDGATLLGIPVLALEDALVLAEVLAAGHDLDAALAAYSERRRHRVRWVQRQCAARDKMRALPALARAAIFGMFGERLYRRSYAPLLAPP